MDFMISALLLHNEKTIITLKTTLRQTPTDYLSVVYVRVVT